jgi:hypothetical protein
VLDNTQPLSKMDIPYSRRQKLPHSFNFLQRDLPFAHREIVLSNRIHLQYVLESRHSDPDLVRLGVGRVGHYELKNLLPRVIDLLHRGAFAVESKFDSRCP